MMAVELYKLFSRPRDVDQRAADLRAPAAGRGVRGGHWRLAPPPGQGSAFLSAVLTDGKLYPAAALALVLPVFLPVSVAVVAGDWIAGEAANGTLRYLLVRPVGRTTAADLEVGGPDHVRPVCGARGDRHLVPDRRLPARARCARRRDSAGQYRAGRRLLRRRADGRLEPWSSITSLSGAPLTLLQLAEQVAVGFITVSMLGVAAIALFLSTVADSALGAAIGALAALVASQVLVTLNSASVIQPYLPTRYWLAWIDFLPAADLLARYPAGLRHPGRLRGGIPWPRPGPTSPRRTSPRNTLPHRAKTAASTVRGP